MSDVLRGKWKQLKGSAKSTWGALTDDDVAQIEGDFDKLVGKLEERYGWERARAEAEAREWLDANPAN